MKTRTTVWITTSFVGFHRWSNAPDVVAFLRNTHRHVFHVKVGMDVEHLDREIEFFGLQDRVNLCVKKYENQTSGRSCEHFATEIMGELKACEVTVSEDGENGATVYRESEPEQLPSAKKKHASFLGTECEGPHQGKIYMFVPGSVAPEVFERDYLTLKKRHGPLMCGVYYGAGNDRAIRKDTYDHIVQAAARDHLLLTIELEDTLEFRPWLSRYKFTTTVVVFSDRNLSFVPYPSYVDYVKFETKGGFAWVPAPTRLFYTSKDEAAYSEDQDV